MMNYYINDQYVISLKPKRHYSFVLSLKVQKLLTGGEKTLWMHKENINIRLLWDKLIQKVTKPHHLLTLIIITHLEVLETEQTKKK